MNVQRFYQDMARDARLQSAAEAEPMAGEVLQALHLALPEPTARSVAQLLPPELSRHWNHGGEALKEARRTASLFERGQFADYLRHRMGQRHAARAEEIARACFQALRDQVPAVDPLVRSDAPPGVRELWQQPPSARRPQAPRR